MTLVVHNVVTVYSINKAFSRCLISHPTLTRIHCNGDGKGRRGSKGAKGMGNWGECACESETQRNVRECMTAK